MKTKIDLEQLRLEIQGMTKATPLYKVLQAELTKQGRWKHLPRGNPRKGFQGMINRA